MTRRALAALALGAGLGASVALAYNDEPDAENVFPTWSPVDTGDPNTKFNPGWIVYEIYPRGPHEAEIHFRNLSSLTFQFDWFLPAGRQRPGDNARITLRPFFGSREETKVSCTLRQGRPGLSSVRMRVFDLRRDDDGGETEFPRPAPEELSDAPDEGFLSVCGMNDDVVVRRSNLQARVDRAGEAGGASVVFRNPSYRDLHFRFEVPAVGIVRGVPGEPQSQAEVRVSVPAGRDVTIPLSARPTSWPYALLRVYVRDLRAGDDTGTLHARDPRDDAGFFPLVASDVPDALPRESVLARAEPGEGRRARVRFRSRLRTPVTLRFVVPGYQQDGRDNDAVTIEPGAEAETTVELDRPADARLGLVRLRAFDVAIEGE